MDIPRVLIAGLRGGSGKTLVSLGLTAAWRKQGINPAPFKKGPDYIDAAWLSMAAATPCRNLDAFLMDTRTILRSFATASQGADVAIIEGNRGLYDGKDARGTFSTAELAKSLRTPVVLVVDCTKTTRTIAALILGCQRLDPQVDIKGVVLNQIVGHRHEHVLREAIEEICGIPVLGAIARVSRQIFPERHLGLVPPQEHEHVPEAIRNVSEIAEQYLDLEAIWEIARQATPLEVVEQREGVSEGSKPAGVRIGVFRDAAFQFYYPENLEALARAGGDLVEISPMSDAVLPDVDALYIGGGFPETLAPALAENKPFLASVRRAVDRGLPIYAECGGAVFLGEKLLFEERQYEMAGVLPVVFGFKSRPQGHGYTALETVRDNPFYAVGESLRGHEFHYTYMHSMTAKEPVFAFRVRRGHGFDGDGDGICHRNVLACYTHVHALGTTTWAPALVDAAVRFRSAD